MHYLTIEEQNKQFISIIKKNKDITSILDFLDSINLPNFYLVAGTIFQTIWNYLDNKPINYNIKDIDIFYYDKDNLDKEYEDKIEEKIKQFLIDNNINLEIDIHNEARVHLWKKWNENPNVDYYDNTEDAIRRLISTVQAIGVTKINNKIKIYAPYGLSDIFSKTIRPVKFPTNSKTIYNNKIETWSKRFNNLNIIKW